MRGVTGVRHPQQLLRVDEQKGVRTVSEMSVFVGKRFCCVSVRARKLGYFLLDPPSSGLPARSDVRTLADGACWQRLVQPRLPAGRAARSHREAF